MKKIYLVYGDEQYFIDEKVNEILNKNSVYEKIVYDAYEDSLSKVIEELNISSLFSNDKIVVFKNCYFLTGTKGDIEHNVDELLKFIENDNENILVLTASQQVDKRKKIVKELEKIAEVSICNKLNEKEIEKFIIDYCNKNGYKIDYDATNKFIDFVPNDIYSIVNELNKMFTYKDDNKKITIEDIEKGTSKFLNPNIFDLIDAIVNKDIDKSLSLYDDLILLNEEEIKLIVILANQFRLIYQIKEMYSKGYSELDISKNLAVHPYRIKLLNAKRITSKEALKYLGRLAKLDQDIKMGLIDKEVGFERFMLDI